MDFISLKDAVSHIVDNRGKTCPTSEAGIPLIATNCVKSSSLYPTKDKIRYVDAETYETWFRGHPEPGDILFVNKGSPGEVCLVPDPVDFCIAQDMVSLRANEKKIDPSYLFAVLRDRGTKVAIENMHVGTMIPHFKKTDFDKLNLPLPSRSDQQFIGELYLGLSKRIALNQKMNQTLEEIAKAIFKSWFVDFDPVRAKAEGRPTGLSPEISDLFPDELVDSEIGEIPTGWEVTIVSGFGNVVCGKTPSTKDPENFGGEFPFITIPDMRGNLISLSTERSVSEKGASTLKGKMLPVGSICVSCIATPGLVSITTGDSFTNQQINSIVPFSEGDREYLLFSMMTFGDLISSAGSGGSVFANLSTGRFKELPILQANEQIRTVFSKIVRPMLRRIELSQKEITTLSQLRDTLLPKLISGELRIPDAEKFLEEAGI